MVEKSDFFDFFEHFQLLFISLNIFMIVSCRTGPWLLFASNFIRFGQKMKIWLGF
jgi:hypothetical protein